MKTKLDGMLLSLFILHILTFYVPSILTKSVPILNADLSLIKVETSSTVPLKKLLKEGVSQKILTETNTLNLRPIIGILSQELGRSMDAAVDGNYTSYIAASYIKHIESAGARVVPILINQEDSYYERIGRSLNGIVFPGGSASITAKSGYGRAGQKLYDLVIEAGKKGNPLPLWATCLGFEMLLYLAANNTYPLTKCRATNRADPLLFQPGWNDSILFKNAPKDVITSLKTMNITSNFHKKCILPEKFYDLGLQSNFNLLSTNYDDKQVEYVSTVEHRKLPIFGTQWHPEKNAFEWNNDSKRNSIPHEPEGIDMGQYMANIFVKQTRHNHNSFASEEEEESALIYNYDPIYVAQLYSSSFQQCYFF